MTKRRIAYLSPTFRPYRVPVFDAMHDKLGDGFIVVLDANERRIKTHRAYALGKFRRRMVPSWRVRFGADAASSGRATPMGALISPTLPLVLLGLRPDVVISNNFGLWTLMPLLIGIRTVIFWEGTAHTERTIKRWRLSLRRWMAKRAKAFVVNGAASRAYLRDALGADDGSIFEGGMCADPLPQGVAPITTRRLGPEDPVRFMFVGQLIKRKAPEQLIRAAVELKSMLAPDARFEVVILGDGNEKSSLHELTSSLGADDLVTFLDYVAPEKVWEIYRSCHVFVLPTRQDNWPLVVPEAMSMGMPVLLSKHAGSVPDLIREGENGHTFDPEDSIQLARLMATYVEEPDRIFRHGAMSLELVKLYTPARAADAFLTACDLAFDGLLDPGTNAAKARS